MATLLRSVIAAPRKQYSYNDRLLDLAYITPNLIVCSMPADDCIRTWFRLPADDLIEFLRARHGNQWFIWNFRAETYGNYDDDIFEGRVMRWPFPDHNPPPFALIPKVIQSIDKYLSADRHNVAILHCKAGQGRSGTMTCAYLMSVKGMNWQESVDLFTDKRMRYGFGSGVSILSQRRYLRYVEDWLAMGKSYYSDLIVEIQTLKLVKPKCDDIEISCHTFKRNGQSTSQDYKFLVSDIVERSKDFVLYIPASQLCVGPDVNFTFHRKKSLKKIVPVMHSTACVWFNAFFETYATDPNFTVRNGKFRVNWNELDGFIGTTTKGSQTFESVEMHWNIISGFPAQAAS